MVILIGFLRGDREYYDSHGGPKANKFPPYNLIMVSLSPSW